MIVERRLEYTRGGLDEADVDPDPIRQFAAWIAEAHAADIPEPSAMTVATATRDGLPSARVVLMKAFDTRGFVFYTNYESQKGRELSENPRASLSFYWPQLERQVRVFGDVTRLSREESRAYFDSRPLGSRIGALASRQSTVIPDRSHLEAAFSEQYARYGADPEARVPTPEWWGGYRVEPRSIEFWQGRPSRLHDRLRYVGQPDGTWLIQRLAP